MICQLDCEKLRERDSAHDHLAQVLDLPAYYGRNLDALYDCLTELGPCTVLLCGASAVRLAGGYGARVLAVLEQAARDNPCLHLETVETGL